MKKMYIETKIDKNENSSKVKVVLQKLGDFCYRHTFFNICLLGKLSNVAFLRFSCVDYVELFSRNSFSVLSTRIYKLC
jgi:hypothetical protein